MSESSMEKQTVKKKEETMPAAKHTEHSLKRVDKRCSLSPEEISLILDSGLFVPLRTEGKNKEHRLFYSRLDCVCFIAVQDVKTGEIVTVKYGDYSKWQVDASVLRQAKEMICPQKNLKASSVDQLFKFEYQGQTEECFLFYCYLSKAIGKRGVRSVKLGRFPKSLFGDEIGTVVKNQEVIQLLRSALMEKIKSGEQLNSVYARLSKDDKIIDLHGMEKVLFP